MWEKEKLPLTIEIASSAAISDEDFEAWVAGQRIFVSSVMTEFGEERAALASYIRAVRATPVLFERFGGRDAEPEAAYREEVRGSDIYVGLLRRRNGRPAVKGFSATHVEYLEAENAGLRISTWAAPVNDREGHEQSFLTELQTFHTTGNGEVTVDEGSMPCCTPLLLRKDVMARAMVETTVCDLCGKPASETLTFKQEQRAGAFRSTSAHVAIPRPSTESGTRAPVSGLTGPWALWVWSRSDAKPSNSCITVTSSLTRTRGRQ